MPICKAPRINSDDKNYKVVHIGLHRVPYPAWKPPQTHKDPTMRLLPNDNIFRFPDNTIYSITAKDAEDLVKTIFEFGAHTPQTTVRD